MRAKGTLSIIMVVGSFPPHRLGGAEYQCFLQARELSRRGHRVVVLTRSFAPRDKEWEIEGIRVVGFGDRGVVGGRGRTFQFARRVGRWILQRGKGFHLVHAHAAEAHAAASVASAHRVGLPAVVKLASSGENLDFNRLSQFTPLRRWQLRQLLMADRLLVLNQEAANQLDELGVRRELIVPVPQGVDIEQLEATEPAKLDQEFAPSGSVVGVFAGWFRPRKRVLSLIRLFARVAPQSDRFRLLLVGEGDDYQSSRQLCQELGLAGRVFFTGAVPAVEPYLKAGHLYLSLSQVEGIPNTLIAAQALGLPAVVSDIPGHRQVVVDGETGYLVPIDESERAENRLLRLIEDEALRQRMGETAAHRARQRYSLKLAVDSLEEIYRELVVRH